MPGHYEVSSSFRYGTEPMVWYKQEGQWLHLSTHNRLLDNARVHFNPSVSIGRPFGVKGMGPSGRRGRLSHVSLEVAREPFRPEVLLSADVRCATLVLKIDVGFKLPKLKLGLQSKWSTKFMLAEANHDLDWPNCLEQKRIICWFGKSTLTSIPQTQKILQKVCIKNSMFANMKRPRFQSLNYLYFYKGQFSLPDRGGDWGWGWLFWISFKLKK